MISPKRGDFAADRANQCETQGPNGDLFGGLTREEGASRMTNSHSAVLMAKHARLDAQIRDEEHRAAPDSMLVAMLKKQKLKIKEALAQFG
jgi:uncharacterized protein YdcH (DUF465 family)